jgi:NADPH:quinone reductase-like Zn-dependent oxidoreductase
MKAVVYTQYGPPDVLQLGEVEKPVPAENEVLVKVYAAGVNYSNSAFVRGKPFLVRLMGAGVRTPKYKILGSEIAGRVEAVGKSVKQFQPGDEVYGDLSDCGRGGYAEYVAVPESALASKPANITFEEAAGVPETSVVALQGLRDKGMIQAGQKVLIVGASGGIGTFAVQIAKSFGAEVTGVCSTRNLELVRSIGADHVIDYTRQDFSQNGLRYDLILATAGYRPISDYVRALKPNGAYVVTGGALAQVFQPMFLGPWISIIQHKKIGNLILKINQADLAFMKELIEAGKVKPVIDRCYPLAEIAEALRYYEAGHARGKVVLKVNGG